MNGIKQRADNALHLTLGPEAEELSGLTLSIYQNGHLLLEKTVSPEEAEGGTLTVTLSGAESERFAPQRFAVELTGLDREGRRRISRSVTGVVERSHQR